MEQWRKDARREATITDIEGLVPEEHLLRKIEKSKHHYHCPIRNPR